MFSIAGLVVVALYGLYAFFRVDRSKSPVWMAVNVAWLVGFGFLAVSAVNWYLGLGIVAAIVQTVVSFASGVSPLSNFGTYVKGVFKNIFFYPVPVFEQVYNFVIAKDSNLK
jgi:hypothetical protein